METKNEEEILEAATRWWLKELSRVKNIKNLTENQIKSFISYLKNFLKIEGIQNGRKLVTFGTDKTLEWTLQDACKESSIPKDWLPQEVSMWVDFKKGTVECRADGLVKTVYPNN